MSSSADPDNTAPTPPDIAVYRQLWGGDLDAIHDLIAEHGPGILRKGMPYILAATRNRARGRWRRDSRRRERERDAALREDRISPFSDADPARIYAQEAAMAALREHLADLPTRILLVVWRRAEGVPYAEIASEWAALGFGPRPDEATMRQLYRRAIRKLRTALNPGT